MTPIFDNVAELDFEDDQISDSDLVGYFSPKNIVDDPTITVSRKRALLAHWASDMHAVAGMPSLRRGAGVTTTIDAIMSALARLDEMVDGPAIPAKAGTGLLSA